LAKQPNDAPYRWLSDPRWYLWEGGFLLIGRAQGNVPSHAHHAIQIVIAVDGRVAICGQDREWRESRGIVVRPDVEHSFDCNGAMGAMLFVDPESTEGRWLCGSLRQDITIVPDARLDPVVSELRPFVAQPGETRDIGALVRGWVHGLRPGVVPARGLDRRVTTVLDAIRASDDLRVSLDTAAGMAFLSPSRFAHLFREQVGLPFSRYMLWRKMTRAMVAIGSQGTIAAAAHAADFADAAHLTRTFYQMVGMAPSALMQGEFFEMASPFNSASDDDARGLTPPAE
jgi:AraC family transcriptional regulator